MGVIWVLVADSLFLVLRLCLIISSEIEEEGFCRFCFSTSVYTEDGAGLDLDEDFFFVMFFALLPFIEETEDRRVWGDLGGGRTDVKEIFLQGLLVSLLFVDENGDRRVGEDFELDGPELENIFLDTFFVSLFSIDDDESLLSGFRFVFFILMWLSYFLPVDTASMVDAVDADFRDRSEKGGDDPDADPFFIFGLFRNSIVDSGS